MGREIESNYALADRLMRGDPRAANPENQLAAGGGQVALDLAAALLTRGGSAEANAVAVPDLPSVVANSFATSSDLA